MKKLSLFLTLSLLTFIGTSTVVKAGAVEAPSCSPEEEKCPELSEFCEIYPGHEACKALE
ncbi:MAG: hypothetical protein QNJ55_26970 [Xenococcus sp. MO_188.B8]|nr:hypothetical protein [Xenococcus sp. MO_188.B8]